MSEEQLKAVIISDSDFYKMNQIEIKDYVKKKGNFDYFPWSDAHQLMKEYDPNAEVSETWFEHHDLLTHESQSFLITKKHPYQKTENSSYVEVFVTFKGKTEKEIFPVLDFRNQDVANPSMTQVNKALKRAFVKALAKHGLGLYIYRGEDLPDEPYITLKDLENTEKIIASLDALSGMETKETLIKRANAQIAQEFSQAGLQPIKSLEKMTNSQHGIFKRVLATALNKAEDEAKKAKKK